MNAWTRLVSLLALLGAMAGPVSAASFDEAPAPEGRQILVMLTEVHRPHFRADDSYGASYDPSREPAPLRARINALNREHGLKTLDHWPMPALQVRCYLEQINQGQDVATVLAGLSKDKRVESAQALETFHTLGHDDSYYALQTNAKALHLDELHALATGRGVSVAVVDTGIEAQHPDLLGQISDQQDFTGQPDTRSEAHGTEVAGLIAASADNHLGMVGVAPDARLLALRACWQTGDGHPEARCNSFTLAKAMQYAMAHHAQVINMSLSGPPDRLLGRLIEQAQQHGTVIVAAVDMAAPARSFPATLPQVVAVSCCTLGAPLAMQALQANGDALVQAPGTRVLTTTPHASWGFVTGSSFATAQVSGLMALIAQLAPHLSTEQVLAWLRQHQLASAQSADAVSLDTTALLRGLTENMAVAALPTPIHQTEP